MAIRFILFSIIFFQLQRVSAAIIETKTFEFHILDGWGGLPLSGNHVKITDETGKLCLDTLVNDRFSFTCIVKKKFYYRIWIENSNITFHKVFEQELDPFELSENKLELTYYLLPTRAYQQWIWQREDSIYGSIKDLDTTHFIKKTEFDEDSMAVFKGGILAMHEIIVTHINYPESVLEKDFNSGMVYIKFVVETDGKISHIGVLRGIEPECDFEGMRVVSLLNEWNPAIIDGKRVRTYCRIPINFKLM